MVDIKTSKVFRDISRVATLRFQACLTSQDLQKAFAEQGQLHSISASVNIYGPRLVVHEVGKRLSKARLYLQHPIVVDKNVEYDNPHFFKLPSQSAASIDGCGIRVGGMETINTPCIDIGQLFDELCGSHDLELPPVDRRIKANLLRYSY